MGTMQACSLYCNTLILLIVMEFKDHTSIPVAARVLLAAVLLGTPLAFTIILAGMISITIVSVIILATSYHRYERATLIFVNRVTFSNRNLVIFMLVIFVVPIILMLV